MNIVKIVQIRDVFPISNNSKTWTYKIRGKTSVPNPLCFEEIEIAHCICLLDRTARTHVMLRDDKGRFISFRNPDISYLISEAVNIIKPFPNLENLY